MKLKNDNDTYDEFQNHFAYDLLQIIRQELEQSSLNQMQIRELTTNIGFNIACLLDASIEFSVQGQAITPILTFSTDNETLLHQDSPSSMHEYIHGNIDELFES
ncbi:hypothetical protein [Thorsellia anophelis]|uniref:Uncharacterized protein n=1 Tax=Thorsellia anophelis DSM 18579 TaxID=1123402 RepID=A0A1H9ZRM1_9GAMM|nr:hypothetical protein [Thorsellia anophelis]SES84366.1 hypothetical protein SAMN02583745_00666 [Thorsellia anophelis DSM 18579]